MDPLKIYIIEDESIVAKDIEFSLKNIGYKVVGKQGHGKKALDEIDEIKPDVVLCDIIIKGRLTGIEVASIIKETYNIPVIFLTAHADEATVKSAKVAQPYGYILKPFKDVDLNTAIEMAYYKHKADLEIIKEKQLLYNISELGKIDFIFVKHNSKMQKVLTKDLIMVEALKDYVVLHLENGEKFLVHTTMKKIENMMPKDQYQRVHRSFIVRIDKIVSLDANELSLENNNTVIPIGGLFREELYRRLNFVK